MENTCFKWSREDLGMDKGKSFLEKMKDSILKWAEQEEEPPPKQKPWENKKEFSKVYSVSTLDKFKQKNEHLKTPRHPNYSKLKDVVARCKIAKMDYLPSSREIEKYDNIGRGSVLRQIKILEQENWVRKVYLGTSNKSIKYKIMISECDAIKYRQIFTPTGRERKLKK